MTGRMIVRMPRGEAAAECAAPGHGAKASDHVPGMHAMIQTLIDQGFYAYAPGYWRCVLPGGQVCRLWKLSAQEA